MGLWQLLQKVLPRKVVLGAENRSTAALRAKSDASNVMRSGLLVNDAQTLAENVMAMPTRGLIRV